VKQLTKAEEEVMQILWKLEKGFVKEIIEEMPEPKPAYNTTSTIVRILEKKGFVKHKAYGKSHQYYPIIDKAEYQKQSIRTLLGGYFNNSFSSMFSFFAGSGELSEEEIEQLKKQIESYGNES
jgi:predicted transcriptional regulator